MTNKGILYLIPNVIAENTQGMVITPYTREVLKSISTFVVEDIRTARRFLSSLKVYESIEPLSFSKLDKDTSEAQLPELLKPLFDGNDVGVISESGCPGVADPGALAVKYAHSKGVKVVPLTGPSSILLALMASGLNGQKFAFHGYLPIDSKDSSVVIKDLEKESKLRKQTQIFIETPYRNTAIVSNLLKSLSPETYLCIACNITGENEFIKTKKVKDWRVETISLPKQPAVFLFLA